MMTQKSNTDAIFNTEKKCSGEAMKRWYALKIDKALNASSPPFISSKLYESIANISLQQQHKVSDQVGGRETAIQISNFLFIVKVKR